MLRAFEDWRWTAWRPQPRTVQRAIEFALVLILAAQTARLIWMFAAPMGPLGEPESRPLRPPASADLAVLARFDPFFRGVSPAATPTAGAPESGLALYGVRTDGRGGGSAIIGTGDGRQASYALGEDLGGGLVLRGIAADHVVLSRAGSRIRLEFSEAGAPPPPPPPPVASSAGTVLSPVTPSDVAPAGQSLDPKQFLSAAALTPQMKDGRLAGYRLAARGRGEALRQAGLQDGDVVTAVDGSPLSPERMSELPGLLSAAQGDVEIRFERNGQAMTTRLRTVTR